MAASAIPKDFKASFVPQDVEYLEVCVQKVYTASFNFAV
jgi:hypothetical protein